MKTMKLHFEKSYGVPLILNKYLKAKNGKYLVFCKDKKHLDIMHDVVIDWFRTSGIRNVHSYAVYSDYPDKERDYKEFCEDNSDSLKILFSINMLNEGLHIEDISGVLMLRTTQSNMVYLQQLGRLLEAGNMGKYLLVFDFVNNFSSVNDGVGLLKEIKDAIEKEKESNPDFDDSGFEDIDTFFVLDQVVEIQEMFREIEGKLEGSWDLYIKALKQYKEREGDCVVLHNHIETIDGVEVKLGYWCNNVCKAKNGKGKNLMNLTPERIKQLDSLNFCWERLDNEFIRNVNRCISFYNEKKRIPSRYSEDNDERHLGNFLLNRKRDAKKSEFPNWKINLLSQIPGFQVASNKKTIAIKMIDIKNNQTTYFYSSIGQASKALFSEFHVTEKANTAYSTICRNLERKDENLLYRGRFIFEYDNDEAKRKLSICAGKVS